MVLDEDAICQRQRFVNDSKVHQFMQQLQPIQL
jgi:hypothetical protein